MARQRKLSPARKEFINSLLELHDPKDTANIQKMLQDLLGDKAGWYERISVFIVK